MLFLTPFAKNKAAESITYYAIELPQRASHPGINMWNDKNVTVQPIMNIRIIVASIAPAVVIVS